MKNIIAVVISIIVLLVSNAYAFRGCCSHHGGVCDTHCCDGSPLTGLCGGPEYTPGFKVLGVLYGKVISVTDGDTFYVISDGSKYKVRVYGVDSPEKKQRMGKEITAKVRQYILGRNVRVRIVGVGKYGRALGIVYVSPRENFNKWLVTNGYAWVWEKYCKIPMCDELIKLQNAARNNKVGIWKLETPIKPWVWREFNGKLK